MKILVTAGATKEHIDDVRYITNDSSGRMGVEIALEAKKRGHTPVLVCGENVAAPDGVECVVAASAKDMLDAVVEAIADREIRVLVSAAAVSDFTVEGKTDAKIKSGGRLNLTLSPTKKILGEARKMFPRLRLVGFKAEASVSEKELIDSARRIIDAYGLEFAVANDLTDGVMGGEDTQAVLVGVGWEEHFKGSKRMLSESILDLIENPPT